MSRRWLVWLALSVGFAGLLGYVLFARTGVDLAQVASRLGSLKPEAFIALTGLIGLTTWLSALRWRLIAQRTGLCDPPSMEAAFALTALGVGVGQVVPTQLAAPLSRSLGGKLFGDRRPLRTAGVTFYEQCFDLGLTTVLGAASALALATRSAPLWPPLAAVGVLACLGLVRVVPALLGWAAKGPARLQTLVAGVQRSGVLGPALLTRLVCITALRFVILIAMAWTTSWCAGIDAPPLALAAALPLVALATALPLTPAGLGVNELTFAAVLVAFGMPLDLATEWALVNRVLVTVASLLVAGTGVAVGARRSLSARPQQG